MKVYLQRDVCFSAFAVFDQDGDGRITLEELKQPLSSAARFGGEVPPNVELDPRHPVWDWTSYLRYSWGGLRGRSAWL